MGGGGQKGLWGAPGGTTGARSPSERCGRPWLGGRRTRQAPGAALWARASRPSFTAEEADPESPSCAPATPGLSTSPGPPCAAAGVSSGLSARVSPGSRWPRCETRARGEGRASTRRSRVPKAAPRTVPSLLEAAPRAPLPRCPGPAGEGLWTSASSPPAVSGLRPRRPLPGAPTHTPFGAPWRSPSSGEGGLRGSSASGLPASGGPPPPEPRGWRMPSPGLEENVLQRSAFRGELTRCREAQSALLGTDPHAFHRIYSAPTTCRARPGTQRAPRPLAHRQVRVGNERLTGGLGSVCRTDRLAGGGGSGGWAPAEGGPGSGPRSRLLGRRREGRRSQEWSLDSGAIESSETLSTKRSSVCVPLVVVAELRPAGTMATLGATPAKGPCFAPMILKPSHDEASRGSDSGVAELTQGSASLRKTTEVPGCNPCSVRVTERGKRCGSPDPRGWAAQRRPTFATGGGAGASPTLLSKHPWGPTQSPRAPRASSGLTLRAGALPEEALRWEGLEEEACPVPPLPPPHPFPPPPTCTALRPAR